MKNILLSIVSLLLVFSNAFAQQPKINKAQLPNYQQVGTIAFGLRSPGSQWLRMSDGTIANDTISLRDTGGLSLILNPYYFGPRDYPGRNVFGTGFGLIHSDIIHNANCTKLVTFENGDNGRIWTSIDTGKTWIHYDSLVDGKLAIYALGHFIVLSNEGDLAISADGVTWTHNTIADSSSGGQSAYEIAATNTKICFTTWDGDTSHAVKFYTSTNGTTWAERLPNLPYQAGESIAADSTIFVVSADGNRQQKTIWSSPDGITWTSHIITTTADWISGVYAANNLLFAGGYFTTNQRVTLIESSNGISWSERSTLLHSSIGSIIYSAGLGKYIACGDSSGNGTDINVITSPDAITWINTPGNLAGSLHSLAAKDSFVVAVGSDGSGIGTVNLYSTHDLVHWTQRNTVTSYTHTLASEDYAAIVIANKFFIYRSASQNDSDDFIWVSSNPEVVLGLIMPNAPDGMGLNAWLKASE